MVKAHVRPAGRGLMRLLAGAALSVGLSAQAMTVSQIAVLSRDEAAREPDCVVTGVVSRVADGQAPSFGLVALEDPNGPGLYVGGDAPGDVRPVLEGAERLEIGDVVEVSGFVCPYMLEPGVRARAIRLLGHCDLEAPPVRRVADLMTGRFNNRRVTVKGVLRSAKVVSDGRSGVTELLVGTHDGAIVARLRGEWPGLADSRDADVSLDGVCVPSYNARAEFLRPEIEVGSCGSVRFTPPPRAPVAAVPVDASIRRRMGVMAWTPGGLDGHLRRLRGEVTYVSVRERFFVLLADTAVRVELDEGEPLPEVGDEVEADGFPVMADDSGALANGSFRRLSRPARGVLPEEILSSQVDGILAHGDPGEFDCHYRLVRLCARIASSAILPDGQTELNVLVGKSRLTALLETPERELVARLVDCPLADLTGVVKVHYDSDRSAGAGLSVRSLTLLLRSAQDVTLVPDGAARARRLARLSRTLGLYSLAGMALLALGLTIRVIRQRERARAVSTERKRMAEELHDTIAQCLSGARLLLFSVQAESSSLSAASREAVAMAGDILETARRELRDKILDLQSDEWMLLPFADLLRDLAARAKAASGANVRVLLRALPAEMTARMKNDLLATVQEAVTNAIRHGRAKRILIVSNPLPAGGFSLAVLNDGERFDAASALGPETGHFGLSSMRERAARNGLVLAFGERKGWMEVRLERRNA